MSDLRNAVYCTLAKYMSGYLFLVSTFTTEMELFKLKEKKNN